MAKVSFLNVVNYLESLATKHTDIKDSYRWNVNEVTGRFRNGIDFPVMLIDAVETQSSGTNTTPLIHTNTTAFTILGKANTRTGNLDAYEAQNLVLDFCQQICFELEARILQDAERPKNPDASKNWLYGLVDKSSFHFFKVGPLFTEGLYGYRCELSLKNKVCTEVDVSKWSDLQ